MGRSKTGPVKDNEEAKSERKEDNPSAAEEASLSRNDLGSRGDIAVEIAGDTENKGSDSEDDRKPSQEEIEQHRERTRLARIAQEDARRAERAERERQERTTGVQGRTNQVGNQVPGNRRELEGRSVQNLTERAILGSEERPSYRHANVFAARRGGRLASRPSRGRRGNPTRNSSDHRGTEEFQVPEQTTRTTSRFVLRQSTEFRITTTHQRTSIRAVRSEDLRGVPTVEFFVETEYTAEEDQHIEFDFDP